MKKNQKSPPTLRLWRDKGGKMPDTARGDFSNEICSDCGEKGCIFKHWGQLVPRGEIGSFCGFCWERRDKLRERIPLGVQPPGIPEDFAKQNLKIFTESGAVYHLDLTDINNERVVSKENDELSFTRARVMCLKIGESMWFKPRDGDDLSLWYTTPVIKVEPY